MRNVCEMFVSVDMNNVQASSLAKALTLLPDYHIGKIFGFSCIFTCRGSGGTAHLVMPLALKDYLLEPGNAFDVVPGLVASLLKQIDDFDGKRVISDDDFGSSVSCKVFSTDYSDLKNKRDAYPEFHVARVFLDSCINGLKMAENRIMTGKCEGSEYLGNDKLPAAAAGFVYYCFDELFDFVDLDVDALALIRARKNSLVPALIRG